LSDRKENASVSVGLERSVLMLKKVSLKNSFLFLKLKSVEKCGGETP